MHWLTILNTIKNFPKQLTDNLNIKDLIKELQFKNETIKFINKRMNEFYPNKQYPKIKFIKDKTYNSYNRY